MANHTVKVPIVQPIYKPYAKIVALIDAGYQLVNANSIDGVIVLIFEREEVRKDAN